MYNKDKGYLGMKIMLKDVLREMRERKQLKQSQIAEYVGVTAQTYMKWENGKNEPKASDIKKLAEILSVSESEICRGKTFSPQVNELQFMKKTATSMNELDEVTFTSILFEFTQDKDGFLNRLESERPSNDELLERFIAERKKSEQEAESYEENIEKEMEKYIHKIDSLDN